jgi:glycosyltransferase involved in cell wall biosynthesis
MKLSVILPAFNEEKYLPRTLEGITACLAGFDRASEIIVVDNQSSDKTAAIAAGFGARVVSEAVRNIGAVRNAGARASSGDVLIFIDADTLVPQGFFERVAAAMTDEKCLGGAFSVEYGEIRRGLVKFYILGWKFWEQVLNAKQGAAQFCRKSVFDELNGYEETIFVGEDVEFYWRLAKHAKEHGGYVVFVEDLKVRTSARRFNEMGLWQVLLRTNPIFIRMNWRRRSAWKDWYETTVR